jgi:membrane dipeptidase
MSLRSTPFRFAAAPLLLAAAAPGGAAPDPARIHRDALVVDTHSDVLWRLEENGGHLDDEPAGAQTTLGKLEAGGVDAQFFSVWVPPGYRDYGYARKTFEIIDRFEAEVARHPDRIEPARSVADIRRVAASGKVAALLGIEGGHSIENSLALLRTYYRLGVRYMTLTWANTNDWADSSGDAPRWGGLNDFGVEVVREMNRLGMLVDVSHVSDEAFRDVMQASEAPVIASHSSCRALCDVKRDMTDEMIRALAGHGGVIQINFYSGFVDQRTADGSAAGEKAAADELSALGAKYLGDPLGLFRAQWKVFERIDRALPPPPLSVLADHIDHVVRLVGPDHVGLGSDFDGVTALPAGMEDESKLPALTAELVDRGYSPEDIRKILGGNLLRVMEEAERVARRLQAGS